MLRKVDKGQIRSLRGQVRKRPVAEGGYQDGNERRRLPTAHRAEPGQLNAAEAAMRKQWKEQQTGKEAECLRQRGARRREREVAPGHSRHKATAGDNTDILENRRAFGEESQGHIGLTFLKGLRMNHCFHKPQCTCHMLGVAAEADRLCHSEQARQPRAPPSQRPGSLLVGSGPPR